MADYMVTMVKVHQVIVQAENETEACIKAVEVPVESWALGHTELEADLYTGDDDDFDFDDDDE